MRPISSSVFILVALILAIALICGWTLRQQSINHEQSLDKHEQAGVLVLLILLFLAIICIGAFVYYLL